MSQATIATQATTETNVDVAELDIFQQQAMYLAQREAEEEETIVPENEKDDAAVEAEKEAKKANVRRAKFKNLIQETRREHIHAHTSTYSTRNGTKVDVEIEECDPLLYIMCDQPNAPQLTATANESRGGSKPMSDDC